MDGYFHLTLRTTSSAFRAFGPDDDDEAATVGEIADILENFARTLRTYHLTNPRLAALTAEGMAIYDTNGRPTGRTRFVADAEG